MNNKMGDSKNQSSTNFDFEKELSALVAKKVIPQKVANKLTYKLKEKNIKINKQQLTALVYRIRDALNDYAKSEKNRLETTDQNMQKLVESIEKLEKRISNIESGKTSDLKYVTTDDIKTPGWELDPLRNVPSDPESIIVLMKWLQHLIDKCGRDNLSNILEYYVDIGWITEDAKISLIDYSHGITGEKRVDSNAKINNLPSKDHIQSFIYIQKLKGMQFDKHFIEKIDSEITRITKKLDNYQFK